MLTKRGYVCPENEWTSTFPKFKAHLTAKLADKSSTAQINEENGESPAAQSKLRLLEFSAVNETTGERIHVFFGEDKKLATQDLLRHVRYNSQFNETNPRHTQQQRMQDLSPPANHALLITGSNPGGVLKNAIMSLRPAHHIEVFTYSELLVDITEHEYVPEHTVLTEEEKQALLKRYTVNEAQLPRMTIDDPISRYFGLTYGQVVKIIRKSNAAGRSVTYRVVV